MSRLLRQFDHRTLLGLLLIVAPAQLEVYAVEQQPAPSQEEDLAKKLQNPVAALISVPFQNNFDFWLGPSHVFPSVTVVAPSEPTVREAQ